MCVYFSLTGDLPFVRSSRARAGYVYNYFSLTGDLPFVRSSRQGCAYIRVDIRTCYINYILDIALYFHRGAEEAGH